MHVLHTLIAAATTSTTTSKGSSKGSSFLPLLLIVVLFGAAYILFIRPRQQRFRQQQTAARELTVGDAVVSAGGIQGKLVALDSSVAEVEVAPGVVLTFLRRAINPQQAVAGAAQPSPEPDDDWDPGHDDLHDEPIAEDHDDQHHDDAHHDGDSGQPPAGDT